MVAAAAEMVAAAAAAAAVVVVVVAAAAAAAAATAATAAAVIIIVVVAVVVAKKRTYLFGPGFISAALLTDYVVITDRLIGCSSIGILSSVVGLSPFTFHVGFVPPQDAALHQCLPVSSV